MQRYLQRLSNQSRGRDQHCTPWCACSAPGPWLAVGRREARAGRRQALVPAAGRSRFRSACGVGLCSGGPGRRVRGLVQDGAGPGELGEAAGAPSLAGQGGRGAGPAGRAISEATAPEAAWGQRTSGVSQELVEPSSTSPRRITHPLVLSRPLSAPGFNKQTKTHHLH